MKKIWIFADDLTGANDTAALLAEAGWKTLSLVNPKAALSLTEGYECVSINLDSRDLSLKNAYCRVYDTAERFLTSTDILCSKRIDSTLRGNLGAESDALLDKFEAMGDYRIALIVPAVPRAGRSYEGDTLRVNGVPLEQTAAARDPKRPVRISSAKEIFQQQSKRKTEIIGIDVVRAGTESVKCLIGHYAKKGVQNILVEAATQEDINTIARGAAASDVSAIAVDPGDFTAALAREKGKKEGRDVQDTEKKGDEDKKEKQKKKVLAVIGSVNHVTKRQTKYLFAKNNVGWAVLDVKKILENEGSCEENIVQATVQIRELYDKQEKFALLLSSPMEKEVVDLKPLMEKKGISFEVLCGRLNDAIADAAFRLLMGCEFKGIFTTGGDITAAVCRKLKVDDIIIKEEILPLAVGGEITLPNGHKIGLATKGGMIGGEDAICRCLDYLMQQ